MTVLGISGSLRRDSLNTKLLRAAEELLPPDVELVLFDELEDVPPYNEDRDTDEAPLGTALLREAVAAADAVLIATPEYNSSVPGQLKNAVDWASRPRAGAVLENKPVAVISASTGSFGGVWAQADLKRILGTAGARVVGDELAVPRAHERLAEHGRLLHDEEQAVALVDALVAEACPGALVAT
jgi:chromate reductase, NAD(P)H dehydrogenase (quinone)